jgi:hypothetical protein
MASQPWPSHLHPQPGARAPEAVREWRLFLGAPGSVLARPRGPVARNGNAAAKLLTAPIPKNRTSAHRHTYETTPTPAPRNPMY